MILIFYLLWSQREEWNLQPKVHFRPWFRGFFFFFLTTLTPSPLGDILLFSACFKCLILHKGFPVPASQPAEFFFFSHPFQVFVPAVRTLHIPVSIVVLRGAQGIKGKSMDSGGRQVGADCDYVCWIVWLRYVTLLSFSLLFFKMRTIVPVLQNLTQELIETPLLESSTLHLLSVAEEIPALPVRLRFQGTDSVLSFAYFVDSLQFQFICGQLLAA